MVILTLTQLTRLAITCDATPGAVQAAAKSGGNVHPAMSGELVRWTVYRPGDHPVVSRVYGV